MRERVAALLARADVREVRARLERDDAATVSLQRRLAEIPAPTGEESARGAFVAEHMAAIGLTDVGVDAVGNVHGHFGGTPGDPPVIIAAHLDTVFEAGTDHRVTTAGPRMMGPGIGDNARGLAALLGIAGGCRAIGLQPLRPILCVATVGEEGAGDLRGARALLGDPRLRPEAFIALDGPGLDRVVHRALGSHRLRAMYQGPGGHSWAAFGAPNPAMAVGLAIARIHEIALPINPRTTASIARIGGGTSLNSIPREAWFELDLRSEGERPLEHVHEAARECIQRAREQVNRTRAAGTEALSLQIVDLGERPSGATPEQHPLVQAALEATRAFGRIPVLSSASTDANIAIHRGIPAVALGAGGRGGDAHRTSEWFENSDGAAGLVRALVVALAITDRDDGGTTRRPASGAKDARVIQ